MLFIVEMLIEILLLIRNFRALRVFPLPATALTVSHPVYACNPMRALETSMQGRRDGFESGGGNFASGASKKNFFLTPPLFGQWGGGQNIA